MAALSKLLAGSVLLEIELSSGGKVRCQGTGGTVSEYVFMCEAAKHQMMVLGGRVSGTVKSKEADGGRKSRFTK